MLAAVALFALPTLSVEIEAPDRVRAGEPIHVVARLVNRSSVPVTVVRPDVFGYELGLSLGGGLFSQEGLQPTLVGGLRAVQWMLPWQYGPEKFQTLAPGERVVIEDIAYGKVFTEPFSGNKRDLKTTPADLPPGAYTLRFSYGFSPKFHINRNRRGGPKPNLTPEGRTLYRKAWTGRVEGEKQVTVEASP